MQKNMGSHIIIHLVKAKHNQIGLHPSNIYKDMSIECFYCNSKVLFKLGMVTSTDKSLAIILCREPCLHAKDIGQHNWEPDTWTPLIVNKVLLAGIAAAPTEVMLKQ